MGESFAITDANGNYSLFVDNDNLVAGGKGNLIAPVVAAWVFAAGTFTSTHAIANPAVTFGRFFTAVSGAGIQANVGVELMLAQVGGALLALILLTFVTEKGFAKSKKRKKS